MPYLNIIDVRYFGNRVLSIHFIFDMLLNICIYVLLSVQADSVKGLPFSSMCTLTADYVPPKRLRDMVSAMKIGISSIMSPLHVVCTKVHYRPTVWNILKPNGNTRI